MKNNKDAWSRCTELQNPHNIQNCHLPPSIFRTKKNHFKQEKAVHREGKYCWTRQHPFGVNCFKASTDKTK